MDDKATLRRRMKFVREVVDDHLIRSVQLWVQVAALPEYAAADTVMAFVGFQGEPDTDPLFARLAADGKRLLLPRIQDSEILVCDGEGPFAVSSFGVSEPQGPALPPDIIGLLIVPGLAFTVGGHRLGYGGGFYDRFIPKVAAPNVGVCFAEQIVDALPVGPHDVTLQRVISA